MTLAQLEAFVVLAEELHYGRAAARLRVTPASLSKRIQELERSVDMRLFDRTSRRVTVTAQAELLLDQGRRALAAVGRFSDLAAAASAGKVGRVSIVHAMNHTAFIRRLLRGLKAEHPGIHVDHRECPIPRITRAVAAGDASIGLLPGPIPPGLRGWRFDALIFDTIFVPAGHRLAARAELDLGDLEGETFLLSSPDPREMWRGPAPIEVVDAPIASLDEIATRIEQGEGLHLTASVAVRTFRRRALVAVPLRDPAIWQRLDQHLIWRPDDDSVVTRSVLALAHDLLPARGH